MVRITGVLALVGGVAWLAKVAVLAVNDGVDPTGWLAGRLFDLGAVALVLAACLRAWTWRPAASVRDRALLVAVAVLVFVVAVNVPIQLGGLVLGDLWLAEEIGVVLIALLALVVGVRSLRREPPIGSPGAGSA